MIVTSFQLPDISEDLFHLHVQQALRRQVQIKQEEMRRVCIWFLGLNIVLAFFGISLLLQFLIIGVGMQNWSSKTVALNSGYQTYLYCHLLAFQNASPVLTL